MFKCHQLKMRMQVDNFSDHMMCIDLISRLLCHQAAMAVPYTTAATQPLPLSSSLLATSSDFSSGVPSLQSGNEIHSLPAHKAQSQVSSVKERAQFWPVDAMPAAAQCKTSDHYVMPQLNEETNVSLANIQNAVDVGGRGDFNEELPTGLPISFEEVTYVCTCGERWGAGCVSKHTSRREGSDGWVGGWMGRCAGGHVDGQANL